MCSRDCRRAASAILATVLFATAVIPGACGSEADDGGAAARPWHPFAAKYQKNRTHLRGRRLTNIPVNTGKRNSLGYVLHGYDVFKGNPSPTRGSIDPGFQHQIFVADYSNKQMTADGRYAVPKGVSSLPCDGACSMKTQVTSIAGTHSYASHLSSKVAFDITGFGARFGASFDYQQVEQGASAHSQVFSQCEIECCSYEVQLDSFVPPELSDNFKAAVVDYLPPVEYVQEKYFKVLEEFGTHYVSMAAMGGVYGQQSTFTRESFQSMLSSSFDWDVYASAALVVSFSTQAQMATDRTESKTFQSYSESQEIYSLGQQPPSSGNPEDWFTSALKAPAPIHLNLLPISDLFQPWFFKDVAPDNGSIEAKRKNVERALGEYCSDLLLPQGLIKSCALPEPDTPLPGPGQTCLGKIWGGGGDGGEPFDDTAESIELHGLFHNLDVSEILFDTGPDSLGLYVSMLQLKLTLGGAVWPLRPHGSFSSHTSLANNMKIDQGAKITAVTVRWCKYVNSMTFWTDGGASQTVGDSEGCQTTLINFKRNATTTNVTPTGAWLVGFFGRSKKWIDNIGFYYAYTVPSGQACDPK